MEAPVCRVHKFFATDIFRNLSVRKPALWAVCLGLLFSRICATKAIGGPGYIQVLIKRIPQEHGWSELEITELTITLNDSRGYSDLPTRAQLL